LARFELKEYDNAISDIKLCIRAEPKKSDCHNLLGEIWYKKQAYEKAIECFDEAIRLDSKNVSAFSNRGHVWYSKGEFSRAKTEYEKAIDINPRDAGAFFNKACCNAILGKDDFAINDLQSALENGYRNLDKLENSRALSNVRLDPRFTELINKFFN
jgi:tetratricopeptide (TPR) repeat protein